MAATIAAKKSTHDSICSISRSIFPRITEESHCFVTSNFPLGWETALIYSTPSGPHFCNFFFFTPPLPYFYSSWTLRVFLFVFSVCIDLMGSALPGNVDNSEWNKEVVNFWTHNSYMHHDLVLASEPSAINGKQKSDQVQVHSPWNMNLI